MYPRIIGGGGATTTTVSAFKMLCLKNEPLLIIGSALVQQTTGSFGVVAFQAVISR